MAYRMLRLRYLFATRIHQQATQMKKKKKPLASTKIKEKKRTCIAHSVWILYGISSKYFSAFSIFFGILPLAKKIFSQNLETWNQTLFPWQSHKNRMNERKNLHATTHVSSKNFDLLLQIFTAQNPLRASFVSFFDMISFRWCFCCCLARVAKQNG